MKKPTAAPLRAIRLVALAALVAAGAGPAFAARVGVVSNNYVTETTADFNDKVGGHVFVGVDVVAGVPTAASLAQFDALLLFEDGTYSNAPLVGNAVAAFAKSGKPVVIGTFYDQDRSDGPPSFSPHGWGELETIDPNTTDGTGTTYQQRTLDVAAMAKHPLTSGLTALAARKFAGGNRAKAGTTVVATWVEKNAQGGVDPAIAFRITGAACVIHVAVAPNYPTIGAAGVDFSGDFYRAWKNAFDFAGAGCKTSTGTPGADATAIPTLGDAALAATVLLLGTLGLAAARRRATRR